MVVLVAVSHCVVIVIGPVIAPIGTLVVTCVSEFTVNGVHTPPTVTFVVCRRLAPEIVTGFPARHSLG